jgi:hypothetical protein
VLNVDDRDDLDVVSKKVLNSLKIAWASRRAAGDRVTYSPIWCNWEHSGLSTASFCDVVIPGGSGF